MASVVEVGMVDALITVYRCAITDALLQFFVDPLEGPSCAGGAERVLPRAVVEVSAKLSCHPAIRRVSQHQGPGVATFSLTRPSWLARKI